MGRTTNKIPGIKVDPELDAVIWTPGKCLSCEGSASVKEYLCSNCASEAYKAARKADREEEKAASKAEAKAAIDKKDESTRELAARELCRRRLLPFVLRLVPDYQAEWFHQDLAARLERFVYRVERGESPRMLISVPPRHGKSMLASQAGVAWYLGRNPGGRIISATHSDRLAMDNSRDVLGYIKHERYQSVFPGLKLDRDNKAASGWRTEHGGSYKPVGAGAGISGYGANILVLDDVHRDQEAYSPTVRDNVWRWYRSSARTRLLPGAGVLVIGTRWTLDDIIGRIIDDEGVIDEGGVWEYVKYPAIATDDEFRLPDGRIVHELRQDAELLRRKGEALHPERYPVESLKPYQKDPTTWAALYQCEPTAGDAAAYTEEMFETAACRLADIPTELMHYSTWDLAIGLREVNDWTVQATAGVCANNLVWLVDVMRDRLDGYDIVEEIINSYFRFRQDITGLEKGHLSMAVGPFLERRIVERRAFGLNVQDLHHGNKDKLTRARPMQAMMRMGQVRIPVDAPWYQRFKKELLEFPFGKNDDMCDSYHYLAELLGDMHEPREIKPKPRKSWRDKLTLPAGVKDWRMA